MKSLRYNYYYYYYYHHHYHHDQRFTDYDGVRLSQNCGKNGPIVNPWVICEHAEPW
jgi:hypothetical protein